VRRREPSEEEKRAGWVKGEIKFKPDANQDILFVQASEKKNRRKALGKKKKLGEGSSFKGKKG